MKVAKTNHTKTKDEFSTTIHGKIPLGSFFEENQIERRSVYNKL